MQLRDPSKCRQHLLPDTDSMHTTLPLPVLRRVQAKHEMRATPKLAGVAINRFQWKPRMCSHQ